MAYHFLAYSCLENIQSFKISLATTTSCFLLLLLLLFLFIFFSSSLVFCYTTPKYSDLAWKELQS